MLENAKKFQKLILKKDLPMLINKSIPDYICFKIPEKQALKNGGKVDVMIMFTTDDTEVDMYMFNITKVKHDKNIKNKLYKLLNELNSAYKYITFFEDDNIINAKCSIPFNNNFNPNLVLDILSVLHKATEEEYNKILNVINN